MRKTIANGQLRASVVACVHWHINAPGRRMAADRRLRR